MTDQEQKEYFRRQWAVRQGYHGTPIETIRNRVLIGLLLAIGGFLIAWFYGWTGR